MFTVTDRLNVLKYLGYPLNYANTINDQLALVLDAAVVEEVRSILRELNSIQTDINSARLGAGRSFQSGATGTTQYYRGDRLHELRSAGKQYVNYLAQMTNLSVHRDVFSSGSSSGRSLRG
jgi:hypothetical protein